MKRFIILVMMLLSAACIFAQNPIAQIKELTGTVELKKGAADWKLAKAGERIEETTLISTGFKSMALLDVGSSTVTVRPLTRMSINELVNQDGTETISVGMNSGRVRVDVKPPAGSKASFTIQTPSATASVRGTVFDMGKASIRVSEGIVGYSGSGRPVQVGAGWSSRIDESSGGAINPLVKAEMDRKLPALAGQSLDYGNTGRGGMGLINSNISLGPATPIDITITIQP